MQAIVLAGGLGTRLRGEVPDLPKPKAPILVRPFFRDFAWFSRKKD
jgi:D-glycero-alpha-D-manno-heptose 1-phosphate guanylyltransferase